MKQKTGALIILLCLIGLASALAADPLSYTVQKGDTLYSIARQHGVSVDALSSLNGIKDPTKVLPGTRLLIPGTAQPSVHVVKKGDTLYGIARQYSVTVAALQSANKLSGSTIKEGQRLIIPGGASAAAATPGTSGVTVPSGPTVSPPLNKTYSIAVPGLWPAGGELSYLQGKLKGASIGVKPGDSISAIRAGTVVSAGPFRSFGKVAFVQASDGLIYVYGGAGDLLVSPGDSVRKGSLLGKAEADGDGKATVYFFVFKGADSLDPRSIPRD
ncbi:MAG TPA: M23 family peptidase [Spirochaetaceae bacterium]|jgi:LysM repeat protein|nr:M23 family peptidase [Spirochaetaceae bacterium]